MSMRILMVHPHDIYSSAEPWTRRVVSLASELARKGNEVKLVYFSLSYKYGESRIADNCQAISFPRNITPQVFIRDIRSLVSLARWADIIHFQKCHYYSALPAVIAAYLYNKPLHYDWDDWEEMIWYESCGKSVHSRFIGFFFKILERFLPVLVDSVSVSSRNLGDLSVKFGVSPKCLYSVPVGADLEQFNPGVDGSGIRKRYNINDSLVLYLGQLHGAQYIDIFIKAARIVIDRYPRVTFMIVGEGFMERSLKELVQGIGVSRNFIFTGSFPREDIPGCISAADICVAPFKKTKVTICKSPLKIAEYLASGKPIVASNVGEVERMIWDAGVLVEPGEAEPFAEGILKLLSDSRLRQDLGNKARKRAEETYNWQASAQTLLVAYERSLNRRDNHSST